MRRWHIAQELQFLQRMALTSTGSRNRSHAKDIMRATHPEGPLCVMDADPVEGQDLHDLLRSWLNRQG
jgi:hypothetical protein